MTKLFNTGIFVSLLFFGFVSEKQGAGKQEDYVCMPCGSECDKQTHSGPGKCSECGMELVKKSTVKQKNIEPKDLCAYVSGLGSGNVLLLDVRTTAEFEGKAGDKFGRLSNAVNIPVQELAQRLKELDGWKDKPIVVYCSHSHRSPRASYILSQNGFTNVTNMLGGMSVWKNSVKDADCNRKLFISQ